jgi:hypothetical protein
MHGAGGGAPHGNRNAWKHGRYSERDACMALEAAPMLIAIGAGVAS